MEYIQKNDFYMNASSFITYREYYAFILSFIAHFCNLFLTLCKVMQKNDSIYNIWE